MNKLYLHGRPFLVSYMGAFSTERTTGKSKPRGWGQTVGMDTSEDYSNNGPIEVLQKVEIVSRVTDKIMRSADIIIDLVNERIVKNRMEVELSHDSEGLTPEDVVALNNAKLLTYYTVNHRAIIEPALRAYRMNDAITRAAQKVADARAVKSEALIELPSPAATLNPIQEN